MRVIALCILLLGVFMSSFSHAAEDDDMNTILSFGTFHEGEAIVFTITGTKAPIFSSYFLSQPERLVLDFPQTVISKGVSAPLADSSLVERVSITAPLDMPKVLRLVFFLSAKADYRADQKERVLYLRLEPMPRAVAIREVVKHAEEQAHRNEHESVFQQSQEEKSRQAERQAIQTEQDRIQAEDARHEKVKAEEEYQAESQAQRDRQREDLENKSEQNTESTRKLAENERRRLEAERHENRLVEEKSRSGNAASSQTKSDRERLENERANKAVSKSDNDSAAKEEVFRRNILEEGYALLSEKERQAKEEETLRDQRRDELQVEKDHREQELKEMKTAQDTPERRAELREIEEQKKAHRAEVEKEKSERQDRIAAESKARDEELKRAAKERADEMESVKLAQAEERDLLEKERRQEQEARKKELEQEQLARSEERKREEKEFNKRIAEEKSAREQERAEMDKLRSLLVRKAGRDTVPRLKRVGFHLDPLGSVVSVEFDQETDVTTEWKDDTVATFHFSPARVVSKIDLLPLQTADFGTSVLGIYPDWNARDREFLLDVKLKGKLPFVVQRDGARMTILFKETSASN